MNSSTPDDPVLGPILDGVDLTTSANSTELASLLSLITNVDFILLESKLILSAIGIIYIGAYGSLRRPPSAVLPKREKGKKKTDDEDAKFTQGLLPSDAILFPFMAGVILIGLYYLIQWLKDPEILSKILRWYMTAAGVFSLSTLYAHALQLLTTFVFPEYWRDRSGTLVKANPQLSSPLPGPLSAVRLSGRVSGLLWEVRRLLVERWKVTIVLHGMMDERFGIKFNDITGFFLAIVTSIVYHVTNSTSLSNLLGYGFCYGSFMILSPTTFITGALVLGGLFFYDIVMVFYTPYMITVATKLDVPIKLTFESASKSSILGLGDIVIPGMVICLSLRFDHWLHYYRQIKYEPTQLESEAKDAESRTIISSETRMMTKKPTYIDVRGAWANWFWTWRLSDRPQSAFALSFKKTYFVAAMVGYGIGMLVTLAMLAIFKHGQPALLYLVPGVLGSLFLTGLLRGELHEMWIYTEDGSLDTEDVVVEVDKDGKVVKELKVKDGKVMDKVEEAGAQDVAPTSQDGIDSNKEQAQRRKKSYPVFLFSVMAPKAEDGEESEYEEDADGKVHID